MGGFACDGVSLDPTLQHKSSLVGNISTTTIRTEASARKEHH